MAHSIFVKLNLQSSIFLNWRLLTIRIVSNTYLSLTNFISYQKLDFFGYATLKCDLDVQCSIVLKAVNFDKTWLIFNQITLRTILLGLRHSYVSEWQKCQQATTINTKKWTKHSTCFWAYVFTYFIRQKESLISSYSAIFDHEIEIAKLKFFEREKGIIAVITYYIVWVS